MRKILYVLFIAVIAFGVYTPRAQAAYGDVSTYAGKLYDGDGGAATLAYLDFPEDLAFASDGTMYVADTFDNVIRAISPGGVISTFAGTGSYGSTDGSTTGAEFALPRGVTVDSAGTVFVSDADNKAIRKISGGTVSTALTSTAVQRPLGLVAYGGYVYFVDGDANAVKRLTVANNSVTTLNSSAFLSPTKLDISADGTTLYVLDAGHYRIVAISAADGTVVDTIGSGTQGYVEGSFAAAQFYHLGGLVYDQGTNSLFVVDQDTLRTGVIRKLDLGSRTTTQFYYDQSMITINVDSGIRQYGGYLYLGGNGNIYRFNKSNANDNNLVAGVDRFGNRNGSLSTALFGRPYDLAMTPDRKTIYVAENNKIRKIDTVAGTASQVIGSSVDNYRGEGSDADALAVRFSTIQSMTINSTGTRLYITDRWNNRIRGINLDVSPARSFLVTGAGLINTTGTDDNGYQEGTRCSQDVQTKGVAGCSYFRAPSGIVIDPTNTYLYVSDTGNNRIRRVRISDGQTSLVAGSGAAGYINGVGSAAQFNRPVGITVDATGANVYVADSNNHAIRKIEIATGTVSTLVGKGTAGYLEAIGTSAVLSFPEYVKMGSDGLLYFSEVGSQHVRLVDPATRLTKLVAGSGNRGYSNGAKAAAEFNNVKGILPDIAGNALYVADSWNDVIRKVNIAGSAPYADPAPTVTGVSPVEVNPAWDKGSGLQVKVTGTNFRNGAATYFGDNKSDTTYVQTLNSLAVKLPLSKLKPGWYDVTVMNIDGQRSTKERGLGITDSTGKTPSTYYPYSNKTSTTITQPATGPKVASGTTFFAYASTLRGGYFVAAGNVSGDSLDEIVTGTGAGMAPQVRVFDGNGKAKAQFFAYDSTTRTGVRVATCDVTGDGVDEILTVPGPGALPQVNVFTGSVTAVGTGFLALDGKFKGGAYVTCGDTDGNGVKEILVAAGRGGGAQVLVYTASGRATANFFAYDKTTFRGGIKIATADIDGDGKDEIVTGPDFGAPHIQIFKIKTNSIVRLSPGFYAFSRDYRGGVSVAGVDTNGDGTKELLVGVGDTATPLVRVFNIKEQLQKEFFAYAATFLGGVNIAGGDVDGDGADELITVPRGAGGPQVKVINVDEN